MYEILTQEELLPFWQYANQHPTVWPCLQRCRIEHTTPGRGTIIEVVPKPGDRDGPKVYGRVRFDEPKGPRNGNHTKTKVLLLPFVLDKRLLKRLALPRAIADSLRPPLPPRKKEWPRFEEIVKRYRIDSLYHFTDSRNLDSVRSHGGLYSWWQCEQRGIKITAPGSDRLSRRLDLKKKLEDYVRLSFNASQPMMHVASRIGVGHLPYHASSRNCSATDVGVLVKGAFDLGYCHFQLWFTGLLYVEIQVFRPQFARRQWVEAEAFTSVLTSLLLKLSSLVVTFGSPGSNQESH